jgi:hypothetical protein
MVDTRDLKLVQSVSGRQTETALKLTEASGSLLEF